MICWSGGYIGNTRKNGSYDGCSWRPSWGLGATLWWNVFAPACAAFARVCILHVDCLWDVFAWCTCACSMCVLFLRVCVHVSQYVEFANAWNRWPCCRMDQQFAVAMFLLNVLIVLLALWVCVYVCGERNWSLCRGGGYSNGVIEDTIDVYNYIHVHDHLCSHYFQK